MPAQLSDRLVLFRFIKQKNCILKKHTKNPQITTTCGFKRDVHPTDVFLINLFESNKKHATKGKAD